MGLALLATSRKFGSEFEAFLIFQVLVQTDRRFQPKFSSGSKFCDQYKNSFIPKKKLSLGANWSIDRLLK